MNWQQLFSSKRIGAEATDNQDYARSQYQRDYDRIIFSSPFRRLQNKTQVFPLPGSVFVHNRLTHSLEVASVGRSLGNIIGQQIVQETTNPSSEFKQFYRYELGFVVSAACLAHDIGNPPFGHSGEEAISSFFRTHAGSLQHQFTPQQWHDLTHFEGNANAFRILTHQFSGRRPGGFGLTYTTLASIVKYPCESVAGGSKSVASRKKYGFFQSEIPVFQAIAADLGIIRRENQLAYARHPFVFLVEAADDICYQIIDWEDAHRLGILSTQETLDGLLAFFDTRTDSAELASLHQTLRQIGDHNEQIAYLRARTIHKLIEYCTDIFWQNRAAMLTGAHETSLIDGLEGAPAQAMQVLKNRSVQHIYNHRSVVEIEVAGYQILGGLMEEFVAAVLQPDSRYAQKLLALLPQQFTYTGAETYTNIQAVVDFVSGMTDLYAVELYRKIKGITFPGMR